MGRKKGFTLIEIMIVLAIIGILSMVLIPKVGGIKLNSKNNSVTTNVLLVRTYLENRAGKDGISYNLAISSSKTQTQALTEILSNVGADMTNNFSGSNALTNPFNNNSSINYSHGNVSSNNPSSASVVIGYNSGTSLPLDKDFVRSTFPDGNGFIGDVVVVIYGTGYVLYGVDNDGEINDIYIIKFPPAPPIVKSGVDPGNGGGEERNDIYGNIDDVVRYIKSIAIERIISGAPLDQMWKYMRTPLIDDLRGEFPPGNPTRHIVNPYFDVDEIGSALGGAYYVDVNKKYSIIVEPDPNLDSRSSAYVDTKYLNRPGTIIVYITKNPVGYVVYGVDQEGNTVGRTPIDLSTEVKDYMATTLDNNVEAVYKVLQNHINRLVVENPYNQAGMARDANDLLRYSGISNAYIPNWQKTGVVSSQSFLLGYGIVFGANINNPTFTDFKGTTVVNALSDGMGFEIFGVNYLGQKNKTYIIRANKTDYNSVVNSNYDKVLDYISRLTFETELTQMHTSLSTNFVNEKNLMNPSDSDWKTIALNGGSNENNSVVVFSQHNTSIDTQKYKGCVIVKAHDGSDNGKSYYIYDVGFDGTILREGTLKFSQGEYQYNGN